MSEDDIQAEEIFKSSLKNLSNGHFQVDIPLKSENAQKELGDSFVPAKHRFLSVEKKLNKNPELKKEYKKLLIEYIELAHGEIVPLSLQTPQLDHKYFVPHLCVFKENSTSTKVRIVFDYSSKSTSNVSVNDISLKGPRVQPELLDILIRFRNFKYALTADISKMYRQIELNPNQRFLQNALWRDSQDEPFLCIQMNTMSFGQTSAPYLACRVLKEIALRNPQCPLFQESLLSQTYVDDILTGVYVGITSLNNLETYLVSDSDGYFNTGLSLALAANRASYSFDFKGPSYSLDAACSSSVYAFTNAIRDIETGETESAIVCAAQLVVDPHETLEFHKLNMLSEGRAKIFSSERDGYIRSEGIVSYFLQKKGNSRRLYAEVLGAKTNADGFKKEGITFPLYKAQCTLLKELYESIPVDPNEVDYVEAHGTGTQVGDLQECIGLLNYFGEKRRTPLLIGSVKSNMGHSESAAGLCSLTKGIIIMETGIIPANQNANPLDMDIPGIRDNKLKVVCVNTKYEGGLIGINSFGFGGANGHVVLKCNTKEKITNCKYQRNRLVQVSGRTAEAVRHYISEIQNNQEDVEFLALVNEIHKLNIEHNNYRGYIVLGAQTIQEITSISNKRPIWFIYSGMGSQWNKMGNDLMTIPTFKKTIGRCAKALDPYGIDLINLITSEITNFDDPITCFCTIASIEIALTDVLHSLEVFPDGIAGHSLGEVGCAYADGNIVPEKAILLAYARGYACQHTNLIPGQMAVIGLPKEDVLKILPDGIFIACQNASDNVTVSGPRDLTRTFIEKLSSQGIFTRLVNSGNIPFHSKYIRDAGKLLLDFCKQVITDPKPRSNKWISSSVPPSQQKEKWAQYNCAEYHAHNFSNTVLFDQVYQHIPENAIVIEVSPHGLLQAILKRAMGPETTKISISNRFSEDNEQFFLSAVGKIFLAGGQPNLRKLYSDVSFPVSRGTKMLSPLVQWDHSISWYTPVWKHKDSFGEVISVNLSDKQYSYIQGHEIDGRSVMPVMGYLELVWRVFAKTQLKKIEETPVVIENIKFQRATILSYNENVTFLINIMKQSGHFEVTESGSTVCTGTIRIPKTISTEFILEDACYNSENNSYVMKAQDLYKELLLRGYVYKNIFRGITECDLYGCNGKIEWKGKFCCFMDSMLHMHIISNSNRDLLLPLSIQQIIIDPIQHLKLFNNHTEIRILTRPNLNIIKSGGIEIIGLQTARASSRQNRQPQPYIENYGFVYYENSIENKISIDKSLRTALQIILQNNLGTLKRLNICEIITDTGGESFNKNIKNIFDKQSTCDAEYFTKKLENIDRKYDIFVVTETVINTINFKNIVDNLEETGFILYTGSKIPFKSKWIQVVYEGIANEGGTYLLKPNFNIPENHAVIYTSNSNFHWLEKLQVLFKDKQTELVYLLSENEENSGIIGLMNCLLTEPSDIKFRSILIDQNAKSFNIDDAFYRKQITKNLTFNVLKSNRWGTYVHLPAKSLQRKEVYDACVAILKPGDFTTLCWIERPIDTRSNKINIHYAALNIEDIISAKRNISLSSTQSRHKIDADMGTEYSGVTFSKKRIMGLVRYGALTKQVEPNSDFAWEVPETWSLQDAATVPYAYAMCYYAIIIKGETKPSESILILNGNRIVHLAAINIALSMGCNVFVSLTSKEEKVYLKEMFPLLHDNNMGDLRDRSFEARITTNTNGKGVDLVFNSYNTDLFRICLRCIAKNGRFLEIVQTRVEVSHSTKTKMSIRTNTFHNILLDDMFNSSNVVKRNIKSILSKGIEMGTVKPLPNVTFDANDLETGFNCCASDKNQRKVLIEIQKEETTSLSGHGNKILATPRIYFNPEKSYILIGGLGGLGLEIVDWMIKKGARKFVLNSRNGISNGFQLYCLNKWNDSADVVVKINNFDTSTLNGAERLVEIAQELGPLGGVFNMALVLKDALILNQTKENFEEVFRGKIVSGQNMDIATRKLCEDLDHFVVFSSVTCGRGIPGQSNYGMTNSAMERLCEKRKHDQLPGLAIQWGPLADVGVLAAKGIEDDVFVNVQHQKLYSCLNTLEYFMLQSSAIGSSLILDRRKNKSITHKNRSPIEVVGHLLGINNLDLVDKSMTLSQHGLDSLMATEIKQTLYRNHQLDLSIEDVRDLTLHSLLSMGQNNNLEQCSNYVYSESWSTEKSPRAMTINK